MRSRLKYERNVQAAIVFFSFLLQRDSLTLGGRTTATARCAAEQFLAQEFMRAPLRRNVRAGRGNCRMGMFAGPDVAYN